ncbi:hypothetical protein B0H13DRAFT_1851470 [Mycena leptocephala]|nr:hypothetical protein B0H13DRAFT_1851470 [Mycena leptocephala]
MRFSIFLVLLLFMKYSCTPPCTFSFSKQKDLSIHQANCHHVTEALARHLERRKRRKLEAEVVQSQNMPVASSSSITAPSMDHYSESDLNMDHYSEPESNMSEHCGNICRTYSQGLWQTTQPFLKAVWMFGQIFDKCRQAEV